LLVSNPGSHRDKLGGERAPAELVSVESRIHHYTNSGVGGPQPSLSRLSPGFITTLTAKNRATNVERLSVDLRGELDWIVMKALEKDRHRRYETANGLAMDIERYLSDEPVQACPPSRAYRIRKFVRKHKLGVAISITVLLVFVVGSAGLAVSNAAILANDGDSHFSEVTYEEVEEVVRGKRSGTIIDARYPDAFAAGTIPGAINYPLDVRLETERQLIETLRSAPRIVVFCESAGCPWSDHIARRLDLMGVRSVSIFRQGHREWRKRSREQGKGTTDHQ
ncbi:MAG TPA: rhodanese-like domain-containing protein, partial [Pirellulaceae bacterium]|nr:rhodanese-like domain-containing protein [Pirellulaceae bacterium]